jgi:hypothetical protein
LDYTAIRTIDGSHVTVTPATEGTALNIGGRIAWSDGEGARDEKGAFSEAVSLVQRVGECDCDLEFPDSVWVKSVSAGRATSLGLTGGVVRKVN